MLPSSSSLLLCCPVVPVAICTNLAGPVTVAGLIVAAWHSPRHHRYHHNDWCNNWCVFSWLSPSLLSQSLSLAIWLIAIAAVFVFLVVVHVVVIYYLVVGIEITVEANQIPLNIRQSTQRQPQRRQWTEWQRPKARATRTRMKRQQWSDHDDIFDYESTEPGMKLAWMTITKIKHTDNNKWKWHAMVTITVC